MALGLRVISDTSPTSPTPGTPGTPGTARPVDAVAERHVDDYAFLDPLTATYLGLPGHEAALADLSPTGTPRAPTRTCRSPRCRC